jgi:AcrR family transcriptional regulator
MHAMQISCGDAAIGLRERKRLRTRQTVARVALELFDRQGFQATTIPQIAAAADVSPRTVSAYFPHKEDLAFPDVEEELQSLAARMGDRLPGETAIDALRGWIASWLDDRERVAERQARRRVIRSDERLSAHEQRHTLQARETIAAAIARDLGVAADALEPRIAAAATLTVFDVLAEGDGVRDPAEAAAVVDRALLFIGAGIRALGGSGPAARAGRRPPAPR